MGGVEDYEPDVNPLLCPEGGGPPSAEDPPGPAGGVPVPDFDPLPMFGQSLVEPDPELEPEPELEVELGLDEPVPVLPDPVLPVLPVLELDDGAVEGVEPELLPELPVVVDVVAALATSAPPATRPEVNAPTASTLRRRICMWWCPFVRVERRPVRTGTAHGAPRIWARPQNDVGGCAESRDERVTIHRTPQRPRTGCGALVCSGRHVPSQRTRRRRYGRPQAFVARQQ